MTVPPNEAPTPKKKVTLYFTPELHPQMKMEAARLEKSLSEWVEELIVGALESRNFWGPGTTQGTRKAAPRRRG